MSDTWTLSDAEVETIQKHLSSRLRNGCWVCARNDWSIHPTVTGEKPYDPAGRFIAISDAAPKVRVTCTNCGNVAYFSATVMGLTPPPVADRNQEAW